MYQPDKFFRLEEGTGKAILDCVHTVTSAGSVVLVSAETNHRIINTGSIPLKWFMLYAPPNHRDRVVHHTHANAEKDNEHSD